MPVDVICQHSKDGELIPMRIRVRGENGEHQVYNIKEYQDLSHRGTRELPNGVFVSNNTFVFECRILVFGIHKSIRLYYEPGSTIWYMTY